jgi:RHS repeat-associated protein
VNRLLTATATSYAWGQSYSYDGFGNLTGQTVTYGSAPSYSVTPDPATNHVSSADANGNATTVTVSGTSLPASYDVANRLAFIGYGNTIAYSYAPGNKRVWRGLWTSGSLTTDELTYWSVSGQKLGTYTITVNAGSGSTAPSFTLTQTGTNYYFGRKLIKNAGGYVGADRLGSIGKYYPYGQEKPSATTNGTEKFTGYFRDAETGLDYAVNRYHNPGTGRFLTPDPYMAKSGGAQNPSNPGSWNKYAYVVGDPINGTDRRGLYVDCDGADCTDYGGDGNSCVVTKSVDPEAGYEGDCDDGGGGESGSSNSSPPPELTCAFTAFIGSNAPIAGTYTNGTATIDGYGLPTQITFSAEGGTGSYTWTETQTVTRYLKMPNGHIRLLKRGPDAPLYWSAGGSTTPPTTPTASVFDAPTTGPYPAGNTITWLFNLQVTVSSGGQTVNCPDVLWNAQISFNSSGGVSGSSWSVTQPTP